MTSAEHAVNQGKLWGKSLTKQPHKFAISQKQELMSTNSKQELHLENAILTVTSDLTNSSMLHLDVERMQGQVLSLQDAVQAGH